MAWPPEIVRVLAPFFRSPCQMRPAPRSSACWLITLRLGFLPTFGDGLKRNTVCSVCTSYARHVGEDTRCLHAGASPTWCTWARVALRWPATPHGMAGDLPRTLAITLRPTSGGPRGHAASTWVW